MKNRAILAAGFSLLVLQFVNGANVQPILTGAGKMIFPEASPAASISASSGALTIAAGGTNKGISLLPSGSGLVGDNTSAPYSQLHVKAGASGLLSALNTDTVFYAEHSSNGYLEIAAGSAKNAGLVIDGNATENSSNILDVWDGAHHNLQLAGNVAGSYITLVSAGLERARVFASGGMSLGSTADPGAGVLNASGGFSSAGTAGQSVTISNLVKGTPAAGQSNCTVIYTGGIKTGGTC